LKELLKFKELGLTQEQGQKLIDLHAKHWLGGMLNQQELFEQELDRRVAQWGEQTKAHPEFGGTRLGESLASVRRAIAHRGGEKLAHALDKETGLIRNLVADLGTDDVAQHVTKIDADLYVNRLEMDNTVFDKLFHAQLKTGVTAGAVDVEGEPLALPVGQEGRVLGVHPTIV